MILKTVVKFITRIIQYSYIIKTMTQIKYIKILIRYKGSTQKIFRKIKNTPMLILFRIVQGFQTYMWLVCQTPPGMGLFFKLTKGPLKYHIGALELSGSTKSVISQFSTRFFCALLYYAQMPLYLKDIPSQEEHLLFNKKHLKIAFKYTQRFSTDPFFIFSKLQYFWGINFFSCRISSCRRGYGRYPAAQASRKKSCQKLESNRLDRAAQFERTDERFQWTPRQL